MSAGVVRWLTTPITNDERICWLIGFLMGALFVGLAWWLS